MNRFGIYQRVQFPVWLAFVVTINKSQGQTLDLVGFHLPNQLFTHGQLYVTLPCTRTSPGGIVFYDGEQNRSVISNVVVFNVMYM